MDEHEGSFLHFQAVAQLAEQGKTGVDILATALRMGPRGLEATLHA